MPNPPAVITDKVPYPPEDETIQICKYILDGLSVRDACVLAGYDVNAFEQALKTYPSVSNLVEKKKVEFKHERLKRLKDDPKPAHQIWILENLLPDEFGKRSQKQNDDPVSTIAKFVREIQQNNDNQKLVNYDNKPIEAKKGQDGRYSVEEALS